MTNRIFVQISNFRMSHIDLVFNNHITEFSDKQVILTLAKVQFQMDLASQFLRAAEKLDQDENLMEVLVVNCSAVDISSEGRHRYASNQLVNPMSYSKLAMEDGSLVTAVMNKFRDRTSYLVKRKGHLIYLVRE